MDIAEQLWLLKQIYDRENRYYDKEKGMYLHRVPANVSADMLKGLEEAHHMPDQMFLPKHDEILDELRILSSQWTISEAATAFVAGLWSAPFLWQSALPAKLISLVMPAHSHTPYAGSSTTCMVCGFVDRQEDITMSWYRQMTGGVPLDGDPVGYVLALREMRDIEKRPVPTEYDMWTFRAILTVIRLAPPRTKYGRLRDALHKEKLLPTSSKWVYSHLLEAMALMGILDTEKYPGMLTEYTTYVKRDERPSVRVEVQAPLAWWDSSIGINEAALKTIFPDMDCSSVDLTNRPEDGKQKYPA